MALMSSPMRKLFKTLIVIFLPDNRLTEGDDCRLFTLRIIPTGPRSLARPTIGCNLTIAGCPAGSRGVGWQLTNNCGCDIVSATKIANKLKLVVIR